MIALDYNDSDDSKYLNKKISEMSDSILSQQSLLTSLLFDTYTNSTFVASDLNVIRVNTSNNYDKITDMESSKLDVSDSSIFASTSQFSVLSDYLLKSDYSTEISLKMDETKSTKFQETSKMSEYVLTTLFTSMTSDISQMFQLFGSAISEKLDSTVSTVFASTSQFSVLSNYLLKSDYSTDISLKMDVSNSTIFASESTISDLLKVSDFNDFTSTLPTSFSYAKYVDISEYSLSNFPDYKGTVLYDATGSGTFLKEISSSTLSCLTANNYIGAMSECSLTFLDCNINALMNKNTITFQGYNKIKGNSLYSNTFSSGYLDIYGSSSLSSNNFQSMVLNLNYEDGSFYRNSFYNIYGLNVKCNTMTSNEFYNITTGNITCKSFVRNTIYRATMTIDKMSSDNITFTGNRMTSRAFITVDGDLSSNTFTHCEGYVKGKTFSKNYLDMNVIEGSAFYNNTFDFTQNGFIVPTTIIIRDNLFISNFKYSNSFANTDNWSFPQMPTPLVFSLTHESMDMGGILDCNMKNKLISPYIDSNHSFPANNWQFSGPHLTHLYNGMNFEFSSTCSFGGDGYNWNYNEVGTVSRNVNPPNLEWGANFGEICHYGILHYSTSGYPHSFTYYDLYQVVFNAMEAGRNNNGATNEILWDIAKTYSPIYTSSGETFTRQFITWPRQTLFYPSTCYASSLINTFPSNTFKISTMPVSLGFRFYIHTNYNSWGVSFDASTSFSSGYLSGLNYLVGKNHMSWGTHTFSFSGTH